MSGLYQLPYKFDVSAFYNARQGYPIEAVIRRSRANGAGTIDVLLDNVGDNRLANFQNLDFHVDRPLRFGQTSWVPSLDVFNVFNSNTVQAIRSVQNANNANNIQAIVAPRVVRFGIKVNW